MATIRVHDTGVVETDGKGPEDATCGHCGRSWGESVSTPLTPPPAGRCPFEYEHEYTLTPNGHAEDATHGVMDLDALRNIRDNLFGAIEATREHKGDYLGQLEGALVDLANEIGDTE